MLSRGIIVRYRNSTNIASSAAVSLALHALAGPIRESCVVARDRQLMTVFMLSR